MRRWPRRLLVLVTAGALLAGARAETSLPRTRPQEPLVFTVPAGIDPSGLRIRYLMGGAFGGYGHFVNGKAGIREYRIETVHEGQPAATFKAVVYVPGHEFEALDLSAQLADKNRTVHLVPRTLPTVPLFGRITPPPNDRVARHGVIAGYYPWLECDFFGLPDCALGSLEVAHATIDASGRFFMDLPDFAQDSTIARFSRPGEFVFDIRDAVTRNFLLSLRPERNSDPGGRLPVSRGYPGEMVFFPRQER